MSEGTHHDHHVPGVGGPDRYGRVGTTAVGLEFIAYRPLRKRNAKPLAFLITAIGMSFVLQEFVHYVLPKVPTDPRLGGSSPQPAIKLVEPTEQFNFFGASVTNVILIIVFSAVGLAVGVDFPDQQDQAGTRNSFGGTRS